MDSSKLMDMVMLVINKTTQAQFERKIFRVGALHASPFGWVAVCTCNMGEATGNFWCEFTLVCKLERPLLQAEPVAR